MEIFDTLYLRGMVFHARHGVLAWEREHGEVYRVDLEMILDLREAGERDDLTRTVDYGKVYAKVRSILEGEPVELLESLGERIAGVVLADFPAIRQVVVTVEKERPPVGGLVERSGVALTRPLPVKAPVTAYVALGSNLGDRGEALRRAAAALAALPRVEVESVSAVQETQAVGDLDQGDFFNAVARLRVGFSQPHLLLGSLLGIETALGRRRSSKGGPRPIDLDLLLFGALVCADGALILPHPRLTERPFVLVPLLELAPELVLPSGEKAAGFLTAWTGTPWVRRHGSLEEAGA